MGYEERRAGGRESKAQGRECEGVGKRREIEKNLGIRISDLGWAVKIISLPENVKFRVNQ